MGTQRLPPGFAQQCGMLLLSVLAAAESVAGKEVIRNSSRECAICHIRWVEAFDRPDVQEDRMQSILERQAGSGDMCLSCHDGSTVDSRFTVWSTRHHTTDHVPSPAVHIPTDKFPLDAQGRMTCATCHTAHAVPDNSDIGTVIFLRQPNIDSSLCLSCHSEHALKNDHQHPLGHMDSPVPQAILQAGGKTSADGHTIICQTCHEPHGARNAWMLVLPPSQLCIACHANKSPDAAPAAHAPVHRIGHAYSGFRPPAALVNEKATFGPGGELTCLSCHRLHDASGAKPLLIRKNQDSSLCLDCHEKEKAVLGSPHDLRTSSRQTVNARGESPSVSGPCGVCHRIHGWAREVPEANSPHSSGCLECHKPGGPGSVKRPYVEAHPVGVALAEGKTVPLPLDQATGRIGCLTCHDPHVPHPPNAEVKGATTSAGAVGEPLDPGYVPRSFLRREGSQLCVLCHEEKAESLRGPHDPAHLAPSVRQALALHPSEGACQVCHTAHSAHGPHLSARAPADAPAGSASNACIACHGTDAVKEPQETRHPLAISDCGSRIADSNDGEAGCTACHNPHDGSSSTALLRRPAESLCTECHKDKQDIQGSVHDPAASEWGKRLGFVSNGICVDCHPIHGPCGQRGVWGVLRDADAVGQSCEDCHRAGAPGPLAEAQHVGKPLYRGWNALLDVHPTAETRSSQPVIRCTTCHEIHQKGQDRMLLRITRQGSNLCLLCHMELNGLIGTSHDLRQSAPEARNVRGEAAAESGPCGSCHLVHPASREQKTWAQDLTSNHDFGNGYCTSCHRRDGCAKDRIPKYAGHPHVAVTNRVPPDHPDYMPIYDEQGEPSRTGAVSCPTCHSPHAREENPQAGGKTSLPQDKLLRTAERQTLCIDCHGFEALWRFLYYHQPCRNPHAPTSPKALESPRPPGDNQ